MVNYFEKCFKELFLSYRFSQKEMVMLEIAFEIGYNLDIKRNFYGNALKKWMSQPEQIRNDPDMKKMVILLKAINISNYIKYLQIYKTLPLLVKMVLWRTLTHVLLRFVKQLFITSNNKLKSRKLKKFLKIDIKLFNDFLVEYNIELISPFFIDINRLIFGISYNLIKKIPNSSYKDICVTGISDFKQMRKLRENFSFMFQNTILRKYPTIINDLTFNSIKSRIPIFNFYHNLIPKEILIQKKIKYINFLFLSKTKKKNFLKKKNYRHYYKSIKFKPFKMEITIKKKRNILSPTSDYKSNKIKCRFKNGLKILRKIIIDKYFEKLCLLIKIFLNLLSIQIFQQNYKYSILNNWFKFKFPKSSLNYRMFYLIFCNEPYI